MFGFCCEVTIFYIIITRVIYAVYGLNIMKQAFIELLKNKQKATFHLLDSCRNNLGFHLYISFILLIPLTEVWELSAVWDYHT